jgi:ParB family chromosome partitioning protein
MMARPFESGSLRGNMAESLSRRPAIANGSTPTATLGQFQGRAKLPGACVVEVDRVIPDPDQPRKTFDPATLDQLAASLQSRGQLVPVLVRWVSETDRYVIIDGERRYRAAVQAGLTTLAAVDVTSASEDEVLEIQLVTNALREDVPPVEQARAWRRLMDARGMSQRELASKLGYDHGTVTRALGLLNLPESIQASVDAGEIRPQTGYELSRMADPVEQAKLADEAKAGRLKRDEIREKVSEGKDGKTAKGKSASKGRGGKAGPERVRERIIRTADIKLVATGAKGRSFDLPTLIASMKEALGLLEAEAEAGQGSNADAA